MRYFIGLISFILGILIVVYRERLKRFTGDMAFAQRWFGPGGTYTFLLILGLLVSILSLMYGLGTLQSIMKSVLGPLFPMSTE